jgi:hypothetical protein
MTQEELYQISNYLNQEFSVALQTRRQHVLDHGEESPV